MTHMLFGTKMKKNDFFLNDRVSVLNDDLSGYVVGVSNQQITIETSSGFELTFHASELVKISSNILDSSSFSGVSVQRVISEKTQKKSKQPKARTKSGSPMPMEVDLHIEQLVTSMKGLQHHDILNLQLDTAKSRLEFAISKRIQRIVFIHGIGEGVLKTELEYLLRRYDGIKFYPANFQKYGHGATEVYIEQKRTS